MIVGILGGGQLARMMALEGYPLGLKFIILEPKHKYATYQLRERRANSRANMAINWYQ